MKLFWSSRSPFARKVMVAAHELGVAQRIELVAVVVGSTQIDTTLIGFNPLGQIPTLVLDDGRVIYDSLVICEYLNGIGQGSGLFPKEQPCRADTLTRHALGQGMTETLVRLFGERKRNADPLQPTYVTAFRAKFARASDALERECGAWGNRPVDIGDLAIGCALAYADFRFAEENWAGERDSLHAWYRGFVLRPSMVATSFSVPSA